MIDNVREDYTDEGVIPVFELASSTGDRLFITFYLGCRASPFQFVLCLSIVYVTSPGVTNGLWDTNVIIIYRFCIRP